MVKKEIKRGLGRGLEALFADGEGDYAAQANDVVSREEAAQDSVAATPRNAKQELGLDQLQPGEFQPRHDFDDAALETLAQSIKTHGLLQPILVRALDGKLGKYEIIAGERRWRAAQKAQLHSVPVIISKLDDLQALEVALVENLQREDLNPIDEAYGYHRLIAEFSHTQEEIATALGKSRSHVANMVRLLNLPPKIHEYLREGKLTAGHARTLVTSNRAEELADEMVRKNLNVRQAEALVSEKSATLHKKLTKTQKDDDAYALQNDLTNMLGMRVTIETNADGKSGNVRVQFKSLDQLDDLIHRLSKIPVIKLAD